MRSPLVRWLGHEFCARVTIRYSTCNDIHGKIQLNAVRLLSIVRTNVRRYAGRAFWALFQVLSNSKR